MSARYFYRAEFVFEFYDLEQAVWIEICSLLCGLGAGDPGVEGLASESLTLQCLASQRVCSLFPGLFPCAIRSLAVASACSAHIPISKLTAAATDSLSLVWAKTSPSAPKSQPSCSFPHSTRTLQPCLTPAPSCKSRKWNFLPFFPPCNLNFLFVPSHSRKSPCQICPGTCSSESPSSSSSVLVASVRWKARKC